MTRGRYGFAAVASLLAVIGSAAGADAQSCSEDPSYAILDFWVGDWDVLVDAEIVGKNRIEKILAGCALLEHWTDSEGGEGKSLFYRVPGEDSWKQVWVTQNGMRPGGVKEKTLIEVGEDGSTLFRGTIGLPDGGSYLDQTRLTPLADGEVRQVIAVSRDGESWRTVFDAIYRRDTD